MNLAKLLFQFPRMPPDLTPIQRRVWNKIWEAPEYRIGRDVFQAASQVLRRSEDVERRVQYLREVEGIPLIKD